MNKGPIIAVRPIKGSALERLMLEKRASGEGFSPWLHQLAERSEQQSKDKDESQ